MSWFSFIIFQRGFLNWVLWGVQNKGATAEFLGEILDEWRVGDTSAMWWQENEETRRVVVSQEGPVRLGVLR